MPRKLKASYLRREAAWASAQYQDILKECDEALHILGCFKKDEVIAKLKLEPFASAIRWDYIAEFLEDQSKGYGHSLLAVSETFFSQKAWKKAESTVDAVVSGRWTATGHSKKTAGYCLARLHGGRLLLYRITVMIAQGKGQAKAIKGIARKNLSDPAISGPVRDSIAQVTGVKTPVAIASK